MNKILSDILILSSTKSFITVIYAKAGIPDLELIQAITGENYFRINNNFY